MKEKCEECKGKGVIPCPVDMGSDDHSDCAACGGDRSARFPCPDCDGEGTIEV